MKIDVNKSGAYKWSVTTTALALIGYVVTWRFYPEDGILLTPLDLILILLYSTVLITSVFFGFLNRNKFQYSFLPLGVNLIVIVAITLSPSLYRNKNYPQGSIKLIGYSKNQCHCNLYIDRYLAYGSGALGSDLNSLYLTDSTTFSLYLGTYDEEGEMILTKFKGDSVIIEKTRRISALKEWDQPKIVDKKIYSLKELQRKHSFD